MRRTVFAVLTLLVAASALGQTRRISSLWVDTTMYGSNKRILTVSGDSLWFYGKNLLRPPYTGTQYSIPMWSGSALMASEIVASPSAGTWTFSTGSPSIIPGLVLSNSWSAKSAKLSLSTSLLDTVPGYSTQFLYSPGLKAMYFKGNGSMLTSLSATQITTGELDTNRMALSGVSAGTYVSPTVTIDKYGRVKSAASGASGIKGAGSASVIPIWKSADSIAYDSHLQFNSGLKRLELGQGYSSAYSLSLANLSFTDVVIEASATTGGIIFYDHQNQSGISMKELAHQETASHAYTFRLDSADVAQRGLGGMWIVLNVERQFVVDSMLVGLAGGASGDTVQVDVRHGADYSTVGGGSGLQSSPTSCASYTTGTRISSFANPTISKNSWVWIRLTKRVGVARAITVVLKGHNS